MAPCLADVSGDEVEAYLVKQGLTTRSEASGRRAHELGVFR